VVGDLPMLWKELHIESGLRFHWMAWLITLLLMAATFLPAGFIMYQHFAGGYLNRAWQNHDRFAEEMNVWARVITVMVSVVTLLAVAVRAATCISSERDRQTLDSLLTTPLTSNQILGAKVLGNVTSVRLAWIWLGGVWLLALITGGLHPFALPFLMGAWLVYAFFLSMVGCWFSVISRTSQRAIVYTLLCTIGFAFGHWLPWLCCMPIMIRGPGPGSGVEYLAKFQAGATPPFAIGVLTFYAQDFHHRGPDSIAEMIGFSVCGLFLWLCGGVFLWTAVLQRFRKVTQRGTEALLNQYDQPYHYPPRLRPRLEHEVLPSVIFFDEAGEPQSQRNVNDRTKDLTRPWGARLIEEIQEKPPYRPPPDVQDTK
jgi:ABC-type transport system involved in multi-copper enzyme maturation permease subunit